MALCRPSRSLRHLVGLSLSAHVTIFGRWRRADILVLEEQSRKIAYFWVVSKFPHPVAHFKASIFQATAGRRRWLPVGGGGGGGDSHALGVNSID